MILDIIIFIVILGVIILVHESGHFLSAKKLGMIVEEFGIGFPPRLFSIKKNKTLYSINLIPLGGFVKIKGETYEADDSNGKNPDLFYNKPLPARMIVVLAGILMNLIFGWLIFWIGFSFGFPSISRDLSQESGAQVIRQEVVIAQVNVGSPAAKAKIKPGTVLLSSEEAKFKSIEDVQKFTRAHLGQTVELKVRTETDVTQTLSVQLDNKNDMPLGVVIIPDNVVKFSPLIAGWQAIKETASIVKLTASALIDLLNDLFIHAKISETISGPVGIYQATAQAADIGLIAVVLLAAIISVNLALLNIVPFPALDGGKLAFLIIEAVFRKRVIAVHIEQAIETLGFFLLILFILAVTYKDIIRIG